MRPRLPVLAALAALVAFATPRPAAAQWLPADRFADATTAAHADAARAGASVLPGIETMERDPGDAIDPNQPAHPAIMGAGSAIGAVLGGLGGAVGGVLLYDGLGAQGTGEDPGLSALLAGYFLGMGAGSGLGAHLFNRGRGELGTTLLASTLVGATGIVFVHAGAGGGGDVATAAGVGIPIASILTAVLFERATTGSRGDPPPAGAGAGDAG